MRSKNSRAFTLVEMLVVLMIISIVTAVVIFSYGHIFSERRDKILVEQLAQVVSAARQQAILQASILGLQLTDRGYVISHYQAVLGKHPTYWRKQPDSALSDSHAFPSGLSVQMDHEKKQKRRVIYFLPNGSVTPVTLKLKRDDEIVSQVIVSRNGKVKILSSRHD